METALYIYYMTRNKYRISSPLHKDTFIFDAFISYAEEDGDFAVNESIAQLEDLRGLQLCLISKRDFRPGTEIAANITEAITKSRKTIIVLSENSLHSNWCMFEFNMARMESIYIHGMVKMFCFSLCIGIFLLRYYLYQCWLW